ncbi:serine/threonine protein kinase (plasmid) [Pseudonocardia sp. EC080610-09]|nr:serine/threonine protein kinase [Pseudonocardia sp. EC080610-09]
MAFWGGEDPEETLRQHGLPAGEPGTLPLAVPIGTAVGELRAGRAPARFLGVEEAIEGLTGLGDDSSVSGQLGDSVRAWVRAVGLVRSGAADRDFRELARRIPLAAHAALCPGENSVASATAVLEAFHTAAAGMHAEYHPDVQAQLRHYQRRGVAWLAGLAHSGGGILADEMGLGKTLQAICLMVLRHAGRPHLVVCPTSLLGTWERELERFAPQMPVVSYYGAARRLDLAGSGGVVLTSYGLLRREAKHLAAQQWDVLVLDEAQQIKNPRAQAAKAIRSLTAQIRLAMTGTPVENRLDDLWSILSVTNPGLLGTRSRFRSRFAVPIEQRRSQRAAQRLSGLVEPHVLRRTKLEVAPELAPKQYVPVLCSLTQEQAELYRRSLDDAFENGLGSGIGRRGRVLALLTRLKQICNHPAQLLGEDGPLPGRSGKFDRTIEIITELADAGERALVFTQYRAMGELLVPHLDDALGRPGVQFLHGGVSGRRRDRMVVEFQESPDASPVMVVSLRAAGYGLTLTRASSVVHYDRWWNPAVEDQASDRVHRIGQQRPVTVYTLLTAGTVEDHIARMHERKRGVASVVAEGGEARLAELDDQDLREILEITGPGAAT